MLQLLAGYFPLVTDFVKDSPMGKLMQEILLVYGFSLKCPKRKGAKPQVCDNSQQGVIKDGRVVT